ncbi:WD repeat-containing protein-like protein [Dothidotthia symphoricarpi CBS 119687]|uniref:WD repeat-containing protein-like protein n=1 Tax=Dothidotthia symphoricarpi CBS 119687 TaxID=1392245 RepID=A0A6A6A2U3_9PLEO|nr:WD repeat-containing protein-like protein [Dothidotthia symphoricarpi CBS 119687]KAF2126332.1 WD repeat-containing protein-like protein [Dothidotthia symphoricarpi CBS 119687]
MSSPCAPRTMLQEPTPELLLSSPPTASRKLRRPPPITPNRFTRFFTPRNSGRGSARTAVSSSSRQLQDITRAAVNRSTAHGTTPRKTVNFADVENDMHTPQTATRKRRNLYMSPESSPAQSSPSKRSRYLTPEVLDELEDPEPPVFPAPIRRLQSLGGTSRRLQRSFGGLLSVGRGFARDHCTSWQDQTANFYSGAEDLHQLPQNAPPFCTASCNTNSLLAIGDEDGYIHLVDSEGDFSKAHVSWRAHSNAVMDVQFSSDDTYLAAGSGDQTAQIVDVRTQQTLSVLAKHKSSVKQVRFQPGDDKIVATSSRDGAVQIWDLRCSGGHMSVHSAWGSDAPYASVIRTLASAHADNASSTTTTKSLSTGKTETVNRRNDVSVTALSFLPDGRQHLLMTASDASTCVKLWDIRGRYSLRGPAIPLATTRHPDSHNRHRHFAINSLTLNASASRLYALSKDNTVYAYSTSHLILGVAPELATNTTQMSTATHKQKFAQDGLGPMYGFRHPSFHAGSFYVKAALRKPSPLHPELLAVGSTDGCPVLFPTDETFLRREHQPARDEYELPVLRSFSSANARVLDSIPIYEHGTPLVRGHDAEVTSVSWARSGCLVSVGDDYRVRRWGEGMGGEARELRVGGEGGGRRWMCGWAEIGGVGG